MVVMVTIEWTPERDRLALFLHCRDPHHPTRLAKRLSVDVDELLRRLNTLLEPVDATRDSMSMWPLPAGHAATWGAITSGTVLEGATFVPSSGLAQTVVA
jgi:hypothetical protein